MIVISKQSMAGDDFSVAIDDAIECSDAQGAQLIEQGVARLPDEDDGEPTPKQIRRAVKWPEHRGVPTLPDEAAIVSDKPTDETPPGVVETTPKVETGKTSRKRRAKDATTNEGGDH